MSAALILDNSKYFLILFISLNLLYVWKEKNDYLRFSFYQNYVFLFGLKIKCLFLYHVHVYSKNIHL